jgi:phosphoribosylanthranilate isomerase
MPSGPGPIPEERIAEIAKTVPPGIATFLLTSKQDPSVIIDQQRRCRTNTLQLVDAVPTSVYTRLREALPGIAIVQVIHVRNKGSVDDALRVAQHVDGLLLDSGNPTLAVKELGGTGRIHDWSISAMIRGSVPVPVFLAGGLTAENVAAAIAAVQPFGVDVCSGVRTNGTLDEQKLKHFFEAVHSSRSGLA